MTNEHDSVKTVLARCARGEHNFVDVLDGYGAPMAPRACSECDESEYQGETAAECGVELYDELTSLEQTPYVDRVTYDLLTPDRCDELAAGEYEAL